MLPSRTLVLVWVVALLALPVVYGDAYVLRILTMTCIFAIFAASWDLLAGYTGQVNFGHALFFGAGAYTSALLSLKLGISPWVTIWAGAAVAMLFGFLVGYLCLRLRGSYLSLATLAFPLIALGLLFAFPDFSGGELGISGLRRLMVDADRQLLRRRDLDAGDRVRPVAARRFAVRHRAARDPRRRGRGARLGHQHPALQDGGVRHLRAPPPASPARCSRHYLRVAGPSTLEVALSFQVVIWGIFGGVATIYGPVAAVFILYPLTEWLGSFRAFGELRLLIFAVIVLLVLLFMPRGLAPWVRDKIETQCPRCKQRNGALEERLPPVRRARYKPR